MDNCKYKYASNYLMEKLIKNCRGVKDCNDDIDKEEKKKRRKNFRILLGFKEYDIFLTKETSVLNKITTVFLRKKIIIQYSVLDYKIDAYFPKHKLAIETDELGHADRDINKETFRENRKKQELQCEFIKINPDEENFC